MASFTCPFCGMATSVSYDNARTRRINFNYDAVPSIEYSSEHLRIRIFRCPNADCKKETVIAEGANGYMENQTVPIYPSVIYKHFPDYIPSAILQDYEEACKVRDRSPKASATLARRCLQGMIRDFWGIHCGRLYDEIDQLNGKIPAAQWSAIDALRQLGNIGAHMEKDTSLIIDISPEEADLLINLIETLLDKWYVSRHDEQELYNKITSANAAHQQERK